MSLLYLSDETIMLFYNDIRREVEADQQSLSHFIEGSVVKGYAEALREEIVRRGLHCEPIDWPVD
jgi:hypothetical protein